MLDPERWRDVVNELPNEAQEVLFVRYGRVVHGAWIGGIFWYNNEKCAASAWRPMPLPPPNLPELPTCTKSQSAAERYQWLRGGSDVPPHSVRWPRFEVRAWDGRHWQTLFADQLDSAIDAAMNKDLAHNA